MAQPPGKEIKLSELFLKESIPLLDSAQNNGSTSIFDTIKVSLLLINDFDRDTAIYYTEDYNDWFSFNAVPVSMKYPAIHQVSGRKYYGRVFYDNVYYPAQKLLLKANTSYNCLVKWKSSSYKGAGMNASLLTAGSYFDNNKTVQKALYTNFVITYFFTGALCFGFFLFLFLYYKSRYPLFRLYAAFLFLHGLYGVVLSDVYTVVGSMFMTHFNWDEYVTELIVFFATASPQ